jgi:two-component system NtrC family sensor kinase
MLKNLRFPIRTKLLVSLLLLITIVVSTITFTMAKLFHTDKTAYIHDLTSVIALHTAQEANALLVAYQERLKVFFRFMYAEHLPPDQKTRLLEQLFEDFQEFVAVTLYVDGVERSMVYDAKALTSAGLTKEDLLAYRAKNPVPPDVLKSGQLFIKNAALSDKLPCFTMASSYTVSSDGRSAVMAAVVRLDELLRLAGRSKVFETFVVGLNGDLLAHRDPQKVIQGGRLAWISDIKSIGERHALGATVEHVQEGEQMVAGLARVDAGGLLAVVQIPKAAAYLTARELLNNLIVVALVLLILSAVIGLFWSRLITRPMEILSSAAKVLGSGQFDVRVKPSSRDEIGDLAQSFNQMAEGLDTRERELKVSQAALIQSEKMAAFGQLGAGIAHEVKNPLAGIIGLAQLLLRKAEKDSPLYKNLEMIEKEAKRSKSITENLLKFARQEKVSLMKIDLNAVAADSAAIVDHQLGINKIRLERKLAPGLPQIVGNANQLQQVLMNLMINAQQAMEGKTGTVTLSTRLLKADTLELRVTDTGPGIPQDIQAKIFEPFFTTKPAGKGTGLGLSVSYGIIKDHKGEVRIESAPGKGAAFIITLPAATSPQAPQR